MRIKNLASSLTSTTVSSGDLLVIEDIDTDITKKITILNIANWINQGCGGSNYGNLATLNTAQTLLNKTLTAPKINSTNVTNATSEQLNILVGATITTSDLNKLYGLYGAIVDTGSPQTLDYKRLNNPKINSVNEVTVTSEEINYLSGVNENLPKHLANIENQIEDIRNSVYGFYRYLDGFRATSTGKYELSYGQICTALGLPTDSDLDPNVIINIWEGDDQYDYIALYADVKIGTRLEGTHYYLNKISFNVTANKYYMVNIQLRKVGS